MDIANYSTIAYGSFFCVVILMCLILCLVSASIYNYVLNHVYVVIM